MAKRSVEAIRENRLARMRAGQAVCEIVTLLSDPEVRMALVPLTEAEYIQSMERAAAIEVPGHVDGMGMFHETQAGMDLRDRVQQNEILARSCREPNDLDQRMFEDSNEMLEVMDSHDINHVWDHYMEMVANSSPSLDGMTDEDFELLKKALQTINWSELSGPQWFAAQRFLSSITPLLLLAKSPGSISTS